MIGERIYLRALEPSDIDTLYKWENDPSIWHLGNTVEPFSRFALEQYILNAERDIFTSRQLRLMIVKKADDGVIGSVDLFDFDPVHHRAGIGILIDAEERRNGYATEAVSLLSTYAFKTLGLHQLYCNIEKDNHASIDLFEKSGFVRCGDKKEWLRRGDSFVDELILQLIRP